MRHFLKAERMDLDTTLSEIRKLFRDNGARLEEIHLVLEKNGKHTGEAFIEFSDQSIADNGLEVNGKIFKDKRITVSLSSEDEFISAFPDGVPEPGKLDRGSRDYRGGRGGRGDYRGGRGGFRSRGGRGGFRGRGRGYGRGSPPPRRDSFSRDSRDSRPPRYEERQPEFRRRSRSPLPREERKPRDRYAPPSPRYPPPRSRSSAADLGGAIANLPGIDAASNNPQVQQLLTLLTATVSSIAQAATEKPPPRHRRDDDRDRPPPRRDDYDDRRGGRGGRGFSRGRGFRPRGFGRGGSRGRGRGRPRSYSPLR